MTIVLFSALLIAAAPAVPTPHNFPKKDFNGGPLNGLMAELRGEKTQPPPQQLSAVIEQLFLVGEGRGPRDLRSLVTAPAIQSFDSPTFPDRGWSGTISPGFLTKFEGCVHTAPWFDGSDGQIQKVHFYWSCDAHNPYILRTDVRFSNGKVESWKASELPHVVIVKANGSNHH